MTTLCDVIILLFENVLIVARSFEAVARYCVKNANAINLMIMLAFFTSTAMQRLFAIQTTMPGTAKVIAFFAMALKPNIPEVNCI